MTKVHRVGLGYVPTQEDKVQLNYNYLNNYFDFLQDQIFNGQNVDFALINTPNRCYFQPAIQNISVPDKYRENFFVYRDFSVLDLDFFDLQSYNFNISNADIFRNCIIRKIGQDYFTQNTIDSDKIDLYVKELKTYWYLSKRYFKQQYKKFSLYMINDKSRPFPLRWFIVVGIDQYNTLKSDAKKEFSIIGKSQYLVRDQENILMPTLAETYAMLEIPESIVKLDGLFLNYLYFTQFNYYVTDNLIVDDFMTYHQDNEPEILASVNENLMYYPDIASLESNQGVPISGGCETRTQYDSEGRYIGYILVNKQTGKIATDEECLVLQPKQPIKPKNRKRRSVVVTDPTTQTTTTTYQYEPALVNYMDVEQQILMEEYDKARDSSSNFYLEDSKVPDKSPYIKQSQIQDIRSDEKGNIVRYEYFNVFETRNFKETDEDCDLMTFLIANGYDEHTANLIINLNDKYRFVFIHDKRLHVLDLFTFDINSGKYFPRFDINELLSYYYDMRVSNDVKMTYISYPLDDDCKISDVEDTDEFKGSAYSMQQLWFDYMFFKMLEYIFAVLRELNTDENETLRFFNAIGKNNLISVDKVSKTAQVYNKNTKNQVSIPLPTKTKEPKPDTTPIPGETTEEVDELDDSGEKLMGTTSFITLILILIGLILLAKRDKKPKRRRRSKKWWQK